MPEYLRLEDSGWRALSRNLTRMRREAGIGPSRELRQWIAREGRDAIQYVYYNVPTGNRREPAYTTGEWLAGLRIFITPNIAAVTFRNDSLQAIWTENGRAPAYAPIRALAAWAADKWDLDAGEAFAVGRTIARRMESRGIEEQQILKKALDPSEPEGARFHREFREEIRNVMDDFLTQMGFSRQS